MTVFDPDWTEDDMDAALDWLAADSLRCSGCGHYLDETTDPETPPNAWTAEIVVCRACEAAERKTSAAREKGGVPPGARYRTYDRSKGR